MKIVIDIDESILNDAKNGHIRLGEIADAVLSGISMDESKGDLISREDLKKAFEDTICIEPMPYAFVKQIIDNAPTVDVFSEIDGLNNQIDDLSENLAWYINERNRLLKEQRPHGKWIPKQSWDNTHIWVCSECGNQNKHGITVEKACWKCGAKMGGGADDEHL